MAPNWRLIASFLFVHDVMSSHDSSKNASLFLAISPASKALDLLQRKRTQAYESKARSAQAKAHRKHSKFIPIVATLEWDRI